LRSDTLSAEEKSLLGNVSLRTHLRDGMYERSAAREYLLVGLSALRAIETTLREVRGDDPRVGTVLDFACGYGRVLRFLRARFSAAEIIAAEMDPVALDFCRRAFSVRSIPSHERFRTLTIAQRFDLIWCGSLITHIEENATAELLTFFRDHLSPGGVCVFSTHGRRSAQWVRERTRTYGLNADAQRQLLSQFDETGYGYADYRNHRGYGVSLVSHERMVEIARHVGKWREACFLEHGWFHHQDVYGFAVAESDGT
jgi:SAM-dependent methyltransferase